MDFTIQQLSGIDKISGNDLFPVWDSSAGSNNTKNATAQKIAEFNKNYLGVVGYINNEIKQSDTGAHDFTIQTGVQNTEGSRLQVTFTKNCYAGETSPDISNYPSVNGKKIFVSQNGIPVLIPCHKITERLDGEVTISDYYWWWQEFTTLNLTYIQSLDGGAGGWLVVNSDDTVLSASDYTIKANGSKITASTTDLTEGVSPLANGELYIVYEE